MRWEYSTIIPAWNAGATLAEAIGSARAQTVPPREIIVVDDGSTDATASIARDAGPSVRVLSQDNAGPAAASMAGVAAARAPVLAFLDADDIWLPPKAARQLAALGGGDARTILCTRMRQFRHGHPDDGSGEERDGLIRSTMMLHRALFDTVGPLRDLPNRVGDMIDWLARAREQGARVELLPEVLALRRITPGSLSSRRPDARDRSAGDLLRVAHAAMQRRRSGPGPSE